MKISAVVIMPILCLLCNACFLPGIFPSCLKSAKVVTVFKSVDKTSLTNYRPISISTCFAKAIEKLVHTRTIKCLNFNFLLCSTQCGFPVGMSTGHATLDIVTNGQDNVESKCLTGLILLDLTKAYDTVQRDILLGKHPTFLYKLSKI